MPECVTILNMLQALGYSLEEISRMLGPDHPGPPEWPEVMEKFPNLPAWEGVRQRFEEMGIPTTPVGLRQILSRSRRAGSG